MFKNFYFSFEKNDGTSGKDFSLVKCFLFFKFTQYYNIKLIEINFQINVSTLSIINTYLVIFNGKICAQFNVSLKSSKFQLFCLLLIKS